MSERLILAVSWTCLGFGALWLALGWLGPTRAPGPNAPVRLTLVVQGRLEGPARLRVCYPELPLTLEREVTGPGAFRLELPLRVARFPTTCNVSVGTSSPVPLPVRDGVCTIP